MALNAGEILVPAGAAVVVAPLATAAPTSPLTSWGSGWIDLGHVAEGGVKLHDAKTVMAVKSWMNMRPITRRIVDLDTLLSFGLLQFNKNTVPFAFGGGTVSQVSAGPPAIYKYSPPAAGTIDEREMGFDWVDGGRHYRLIVPKGMVTNAIDTDFVRTKEAVLPIGFGVTAGDTGDPWYPLTDDPAFA